MKQYYVYFLTNFTNSVVYTGVTNDLLRRVYEHRQKLIPGFTNRYQVWKLVHYEATGDVESAIAREKQIKGWTRKKRIDLINSMNPRWLDLSEGWYEGAD